MTTPATRDRHRDEPHAAGGSHALTARLRAAVLGANDGIVSTSALVVGVAGAGASRGEVFTAGLAGLVAGAVSMAVGEYVSVSSQGDLEDALLDKERRELADEPERELAELAAIYRAKGLTAETADRVARELSEQDAFAAHVDAELGMDLDDRADPWAAASSSAVSFVTGAVLPLVAVLVASTDWRIPVTVVVVLLALAATGAISARVSGARARRAVSRVVVGGATALAVTYAVGRLFGTAIG